MKQSLFFLCLMAALSFSCQKDHTILLTDCMSSILTGEWSWDKTEDPQSGTITTSHSSMFSRRLFIDDLHWREYNNAALVFESTYSFTLDSSSYYTHGWVDFATGSRIRIMYNYCFLYYQCEADSCSIHTFGRRL
jgi:hypothetical protein